MANEADSSKCTIEAWMYYCMYLPAWVHQGLVYTGRGDGLQCKLQHSTDCKAVGAFVCQRQNCLFMPGQCIESARQDKALQERRQEKRETKYSVSECATQDRSTTGWQHVGTKEDLWFLERRPIISVCRQALFGMLSYPLSSGPVRKRHEEKMPSRPRSKGSLPGDPAIQRRCRGNGLGGRGECISWEGVTIGCCTHGWRTNSTVWRIQRRQK